MNEDYRKLDREELLEIITEKIEDIRIVVSAAEMYTILEDLEAIENMVVEL